ncbi:unnamed protein product, partial [Umbelopsis sp. WA50703]
MAAITRRLETRHPTTSVEHPQAYRLVERLNRTIKTSVASYAETDPTTWDEKLP